MGVYSVLLAASAVAATVVYGASLCTDATSISPSLYPPGAPICAEFDSVLTPTYSVNPECSNIYEKLTCNFQSLIGALGGALVSPDWTEEEITDLCSTCIVFSKFLSTELSESDDLGCNFLADYINDLCYFHVAPGATAPTNCYADYEGGFFQLFGGYAGGDALATLGLKAKCGALSPCDESHFTSLTSYFAATTSQYETYLDAIAFAEAPIDLESVTISEFCDFVLNVTDGATFNPADIPAGAPWVFGAAEFPFSWDPFLITDTGDGTTACDADTAKAPDSDSTAVTDATCPSWSELIKSSGADDSCVELINNVRCNMNSLTGGSSNFFLSSQIADLCTGTCAPFTKYVIEQLENAPADEPGCEFIQVFLQGTCTKYDALDGSSDLCTNRGSAFLRAIRSSLTAATAVAGQNQFVSACSAYSCCEDAAFAVLPYYFEISDSITELGLADAFPIAVGTDNVTAVALCVETGASAVLSTNGDVCYSTLTEVSAFSPSGDDDDDAAVGVYVSSAVMALIIAVAVFFV